MAQLLHLNYLVVAYFCLFNWLQNIGRSTLDWYPLLASVAKPWLGLRHVLALSRSVLRKMTAVFLLQIVPFLMISNL